MQKLSKQIFNLVFIIVLPLLFLDAYRSKATVDTFLQISSRSIEVNTIVFLILLRLFYSQPLHPVLSKFNKYLVMPLTLILGAALTIWDYFSTANYVYSLTLIQYTQLFYIGIFSLIVWLLDHNNSWFLKYFHKAVFFGSLVFIGISSIIYLFPRDVFAKLSKEDRLVENIQFWVLVVAAIFAFRSGLSLYKKKDIKNSVVFIIAALLLFFSAADEISWGQRILDIKTPESIASVNEQKELTIHNLSVFSGFVRPIYEIVGLYGGTFWIISSFFKKLSNKPFYFYIPSWSTSLFYLPAFIFNFYSSIAINPFIGIFAEPVELMLYFGVMFTMIGVFLRLEKKIPSSISLQMPF